MRKINYDGVWEGFICKCGYQFMVDYMPYKRNHKPASVNCPSCGLGGIYRRGEDKKEDEGVEPPRWQAQRHKYGRPVVDGALQMDPDNTPF